MLKHNYFINYLLYSISIRQKYCVDNDVCQMYMYIIKSLPHIYFSIAKEVLGPGSSSVLDASLMLSEPCFEAC